MPVDRVRRDAAAAALASFLRHETDHVALGAELRRLSRLLRSEEKVRSERDTYLVEMLAGWSPIERGNKAVSVKMWEEMCRTLAFLRTDLEERPWPGLSRDEDESWQALTARRHALALLPAAGVAYAMSWWVFAAATAVSFLVFEAAMREHESTLNEAIDRQRRQRWDNEPFADGDEWSAHRHLLDGYSLPAYDAVAFDVRSRARRWLSRITAPFRWACYLVAAAMLACMFLGSMCMWPAAIAWMSLAPRPTGRP
jgi:hypothetical protein